MAQYYNSNPQQAYTAQNLQFYSSSYGAPVPDHTSSSGGAAAYGGSPYGASSGAGSAGTNQSAQAYGGDGVPAGFMAGSPGFGQAGQVVGGRMGEQGGLRTGWLAAFGTEGYDGEPALLEELGVNFGHIKGKTLTVLNPMARVDQHIMDDSDLFGPIIFCLLFGTFLLLAGKVHFGYIYGLAAIGSVSLHLIFSLMSNPVLETSSSSISSPPYNTGMSMNHSLHHDHHHHHHHQQQQQQQQQQPQETTSTLTFFRSCSVLGYCLLPLVLTSFIGIAAPMDTLGGYALTCGAVAWCTYSSSGMFCAVGRMRSMRPLVAYPLMLFYVGFGIMGIFSSRGSGALAARAAL